MPVTRKQKRKARRSREADMIPDLESMDVMIGSCHYEGEDSEFGNSVRKSDSPRYDALIYQNSNSSSNLRENKSRGFARTDKCHVKLAQTMKWTGCLGK